MDFTSTSVTSRDGRHKNITSMLAWGGVNPLVNMLLTTKLIAK